MKKGEIQEGDIVKLNGQTTPMTIDSIHRLKEFARCVWIDKDGKLQKGDFYFHSLSTLNVKSTE